MKIKIVRWIKAKVKQARAKGIVIGLSGGIDSCVASALAKEAVGKNKVLGLILPIHSHSRDITDARVFARKSGIKTKTIDLSEVYDKLMKVLPKAPILAGMNLKPRLRMAVLYYYANKLDYLVCGTGNKAELSVGYFTKYGDGGVDILPLGDLLKRQVRTLAVSLGVPEEIVIKPPTAGLWPGQTDEGEMGISYEVLDDVLNRLENKLPQRHARNRVNKVKLMVRRSGHKREKPQICRI